MSMLYIYYKAFDEGVQVFRPFLCHMGWYVWGARSRTIFPE